MAVKPSAVGRTWSVPADEGLMVLRKTVIVGLIILCDLTHTAWGSDSPPSTAAQTLFVYPSNHGFLHQTGQHVPLGWAAMYQNHAPGYFIEGQISGGEKLEPGTYRYVFRGRLLSGQLGGLLSKANDVIRIEAWDVTTHECLMSRTFQVSDFIPQGSRPVEKSLIFSTLRRGGHSFEPRVYWQGLSGVFLQNIELQRLPAFEPKKLNEKAMRFEEAMGTFYIDRGYVLCRRLDGDYDDMGDAAIWTGLYAASQAWRYKSTRSLTALERMQDALRALHQLYLQAPEKGTLVRYVYPDGRIHPDAASKDTYTGFFFAVQNCLPFIKDKKLRKALLEDIEGLAGHFLDHDLAFVPTGGKALELSPSISSVKLGEVIEGLRSDARDRGRVIRLMEAVYFYFLIHGQRPWPELPQMIRSLKNEDFDGVHDQMIPFLNGALRALQQLQKNVHRSAILWRWKDAPYQKLDRILLQMMKHLSVTARPEIKRLDELKFLSSQSIHSLHFLKAAGELLPKPNRYRTYYEDNLWQGQALLKTAVEWTMVDEDLIAAVTGDAQAAASRTNSNHLSYLALFDLYQAEKDPALRKVYKSIFELQAKPLQADGNAMLQIMQSRLTIKPDLSGLAVHTLALYPDDRQGKGEKYWREHWEDRADRYGGEISGQARDPLPVNELQKDPFIWQRSARSLRGDHAHLLYPPLDYLFVYWLGRASGEISSE